MIPDISLYDLAPTIADAASSGEGFDWKDWFEEDFVDSSDSDQVALLWHQLRRLQAATSALIRSMEPDLAELLKEQGSTSFGDVLIYASPKKTEVCIDEAGFWDWVEKQDPKLVRQLFNPNSVRVTPLPTSARETFFEIQYGDGVKVVEASKEYIK